MSSEELNETEQAELKRVHYVEVLAMYRKQESARQGLPSKIRTALFSLVATTTLTLTGFVGTGTAAPSTAAPPAAPMHSGTDCAPPGCHSPGAGWRYVNEYWTAAKCDFMGGWGKSWGDWHEYQCT